MLYIIDGYNLLHAMEPGRIKADNLEKKRTALIEAIVNVTATGGDEAILVFDSSESPNATSQLVPGTSVTVSFASSTESADIQIGKIVRAELGKRRERIRVVSADWEVQKGALQKRVERIAPRHYLARLKKYEKKVAISEKMDRIHWKLEHKVDLETFKKLEDLRRGRNNKQ